jgi:hypothetical protein
LFADGRELSFVVVEFGEEAVVSADGCCQVGGGWRVKTSQFVSLADTNRDNPTLKLSVSYLTVAVCVRQRFTYTNFVCPYIGRVRTRSPTQLTWSSHPASVMSRNWRLP